MYWQRKTAQSHGVWGIENKKNEGIFGLNAPSPRTPFENGIPPKKITLQTIGQSEGCRGNDLRWGLVGAHHPAVDGRSDGVHLKGTGSRPEVTCS